MNTPFGGARQRGRSREPQLSEFPAWALEIMMGLYGPDTIAKACDQRDTDAVTRDEPVPRPYADRTQEVGPGSCAEVAPHPIADDSCGRPSAAPQPLSPIVVELEAINEFIHFLERKFKRH